MAVKSLHLHLEIISGGNYATTKKRILALAIDTSHMTGQAWNRGKVHGPKRHINDYLNNSSTIQSHKLRLRLIAEKVLEAKCYECNNVEWLGNPIPLELEHIDGNHSNNTLSNLTLLCPNCHALTNTYRGKNKRIKRLARDCHQPN